MAIQASSAKFRLHDADGKERELERPTGPRRPAKQYLRVTGRGRWIGDFRTVVEVATHVDLASLEPLH